MHPDDLLIKQAAKGNQSAFAELVERYQAYVFAVILKLIKDNAYAENIAQETFIQVYISLPQYKYQGFKSWIGRIAVNKAIDWQRKTARIASKETVIDVQEFILKSDTESNLEDQIILDQDKEKLKVLYSQLPPLYKTIVKDFYFAGKSYKQIADETGIAQKTIESRLYRARKLLRKKWQEGG